MARTNAELDIILDQVGWSPEQVVAYQMYQSYQFHGMNWRKVYLGSVAVLPAGLILGAVFAVTLSFTRLVNPWVVLVGWVNVVLFSGMWWMVAILLDCRIHSDCAKAAKVLRVLEK